MCTCRHHLRLTLCTYTFACHVHGHYFFVKDALLLKIHNMKVRESYTRSMHNKNAHSRVVQQHTKLGKQSAKLSCIEHRYDFGGGPARISHRHPSGIRCVLNNLKDIVPFSSHQVSFFRGTHSHENDGVLCIVWILRGSRGCGYIYMCSASLLQSL
jgi:hypothetical protein